MMNKVPKESVNITEQNIEKMKELFPEILTDGNQIDFEKLQLILGKEVDNQKERYSFNWPGKREAILGAQTPSKGTLRPNKEKSKNFDKTENLYIEGDNLEVLKLLQKSYNNKIKVIYIDPPYNTGKDFVYKDNFRSGIDNYLEQTGQVDAEGNVLSTNSESNGSFHTDWLNMMYPRLKLARNLLTDDGVIFISIDDNEYANLKKICDEIFGERNFIAPIVRNTNSSKNQSLFVSVSHDYCLVYSKNISFLEKKHSNKKWEVLKNNIEAYENKVKELQKLGLSNDEITEELKILTKYPRFIDFTNYWYLDNRGVYRKDNLGGVKNGNSQVLINPLTNKEDPIPPGGFRYNKEKLNEMILDNRIHFHIDGSLPTIKRYLNENRGQRPKAIMSDDQRPDDRVMKEFNLSFDNPKQLSFIKRILSVFDSDSIILDFFSGSSTTAHAAIHLNSEDLGSRKFIMVQLPEKLEESTSNYKNGYKTISDIGSQRIRYAGEKIIKEIPEIKNKLDIGFKYLQLGKSNIKEWNTDFDNLENELDLFGDILVEGRSELDVVYEIMLKNGLELTLPVQNFEVDGKVIYNIAFGLQFICLADDINTKVAQAIIDKRNEYGEEIISGVVFKDSGFNGNDSEKLNCIQLLKDAGFIEDNLQTI